jgi:hypothetical protein
MWFTARFVYSDEGAVALDWIAMSAALALLGAVGIQAMMAGAETPVNALLAGLRRPVAADGTAWIGTARHMLAAPRVTRVGDDGDGVFLDRPVLRDAAERNEAPAPAYCIETSSVACGPTRL